MTEKPDVLLNNEPERKPEVSQEIPVISYKTKTIHFGPVEHTIVMQNKNGPCPMIALINCLAMKGDITLPKRDKIEHDWLINKLSESFFDEKIGLSKEEEEVRAANVNDALTVVPQLKDGLDVNVLFSGVTKFEFTKAIALFDVLKVKLYHAWIPDPQFDITRVIQPLSVNKLLEMICDETIPNYRELSTWYETNTHQVTFDGLCALNMEMRDGELAVLFHHSHFSTCLKRRDEIFLLATDEGFVDRGDRLVWQSLSSTDGDACFVDADFHTYRELSVEREVPTKPQPTPEKQQQQLIEWKEGVEIGVEAAEERPASVPPLVNEERDVVRRSWTTEDVGDGRRAASQEKKDKFRDA